MSAKGKDGNKFWSKLTSSKQEAACGREWEGEASAGLLNLQHKPRLHGIYDIETNGFVERLIVTDEAVSPIVGPHPWQISNPGLINAVYISQLVNSLEELSFQETQRVNTRFDLVQRRVRERWGVSVQEEECIWVTVHGDLHWANLTAPKLTILDWEGWGKGLSYQDIALLFAFTGLFPDVQNVIRSVLGPGLESQPGRLSLMFVTAELLRMADLYGDHPQLVPSLTCLGSLARDGWLG